MGARRLVPSWIAVPDDGASGHAEMRGLSLYQVTSNKETITVFEEVIQWKKDAFVEFV